jgi:hypothetical protein
MRKAGLIQYLSAGRGYEKNTGIPSFQQESICGDYGMNYRLQGIMGCSPIIKENSSNTDDGGFNETDMDGDCTMDSDRA